MQTKLWQIPQPPFDDDIANRYSQLQNRIEEILQNQQNIVLAHSLSVEDTLITHTLFSAAKKYSDKNIRYITLDTGRLPATARQSIDQINQHFQLSLELIKPEEKAVESWVLANGLDAFYQSEEAKKSCCYLRKIAPLNIVLNSAQAWLTGQRQAQSITRAELSFVETGDKITKYNPLYDFSENEVWAAIHHFQLPINRQYYLGYPSIGCEPCTRPVKVGDDIRSGRWWWLQSTQKECGLHI